MKLAPVRHLMQKACLAFCAGFILQLSSTGQNIQSVPTDGNSMLFSKTYDTLITGDGYGDHKISFSQWDPREGKLVAAVVKAIPIVQYGFKLKNADSLGDNYTVTLGRKDSLSSPVLATPFHNSRIDTIGSFPLQAGKMQGQLPDILNSDHNYRDSITDNIQAFEGTGKLDFTYSPSIWSKVYSDSNASFHYDATIRDSTHLSVTYYYTVEKTAPKEMATIPPAENNKLTLYPNPAKDFIQLTFNSLAGSDWQVDILAADGHIIQSNRYMNATQARVDFSVKLAAGAYFARVTDIRTTQHYTVTFAVL